MESAEGLMRKVCAPTAHVAGWPAGVGRWGGSRGGVGAQQGSTAVDGDLRRVAERKRSH
jgi:hypothetical protein